jgi:hypothetical protein
MHVKTVLSVLCAIGLIPAGMTQADPISVTSGFVVTGATESHALFSLTGLGDTHIQGAFPGLSLACQSCVAGGLASPRGRFLYDNVPFEGGDPFATGSATIRGVMYPFLFFSGDLNFSGPSFRLPEIVGPDDRDIVFAQPFRFSATVSGFDRLEGHTELQPLFSTTWTGGGTAQVRFVGNFLQGQSHYSYVGTNYEFEPVPEPATLLLCATGMTALIRRRHTPRGTHACPFRLKPPIDGRAAGA